MGFGKRWMKWIEAMVFKSSICVLVNGSPTKEFLEERGLSQGAPLSPFLFVLVAEGLRGLVSRASQVQDFKGLNVKGKCYVDILQYADDTLLIGEGGWKHVWSMKFVLIGFELVSGLGDFDWNQSEENFIVAASGGKIEVAFGLLEREISQFWWQNYFFRVGSRFGRRLTWPIVCSRMHDRMKDIRSGLVTILWLLLILSPLSTEAA
ncbi:uncharacterized protein LOC131613475 [Vicia villosa]|uniref:uncharacterized protein LOC131613475 n=1 Tax=Vicia villosa TaxID=3911 RepID=UPI00273C8FF2|nr:uncharacterized protein LOC131613475 [Vicia villosa]